MTPSELSALRAYLAHDRAHPGAVAWLEGEGQPGTRTALDRLTATGHLERGLFGLRRISPKGKGALARLEAAQG